MSLKARAKHEFTGNGERTCTALAAGEALFALPATSFWFVQCRTDDVPRQLGSAIWENGYGNKYTGHVRRMKAGDKIAIKSPFNRKKNLPFEIGGRFASGMRIIAVGPITSNPGNGHAVYVDWHPVEPPREWFFYTYLNDNPVVEAKRDDELARRLILFTFFHFEQDHAFWLALPYWAKMYGCAAEPAG